MSPSTLADAFSKDSSATAIIVPGSPALHVSYQKLTADVKAFQQQLANVGVSAQAAVREYVESRDITVYSSSHRSPSPFPTHMSSSYPSLLHHGSERLRRL